MRYARVVAVLAAGALAWGCGGADRQQGGQADQGAEADRPVAREARPASGTDRALGEFEPLTAADLDLYLKVMREAAARLGALSQSDREALQLWRDASNGTNAAQVPTADQVAALQRAGELAAMDATVARGMGLEQRFSSIAGRVDHFLEPGIEAGGEPLTAEEEVRVQERIRRLRELERSDAALLQPQRAEIVVLRNQARVTLPPVDVTN